MKVNDLLHIFTYKKTLYLHVYAFHLFSAFYQKPYRQRGLLRIGDELLAAGSFLLRSLKNAIPPGSPLSLTVDDSKLRFD